MNLKSMLLLVTAFILYLVIGALIFSALESTQEEATKVDLRQYKEAILSNLTCLSEDGLEELIGKIRYAVDNGINPTYNVSSHSNWDFSNSFFFSGTVVTTIGYGHISPSTSGGRAFCIIYALIGIPLFGILMAAISENLKKQGNRLEDRLGRKFVQHPKAKSSIYAILLLALCLLFFMIIPAAIFAHIEKWTYYEAFYYSFITLTTIGFGDFVIGTNPDIEYHILYKWTTYCWIIIGLAMLALFIAYIADALTNSAEKIQQKSEDMIKRQQGVADDSAGNEGGKEEMESGDAKIVWEGDGDREELKELKDKNGVDV